MADHVEWVFLAYRLPRDPSTPRITVWRKLRRIGATHIVDGLVALPADARTREHLDWLADEIIEAGGRASVWRASATTKRQERELVEQMQQSVTAEYEAVVAEAAAAGENATPRTVNRLRAELRRIARRNYFPTKKTAEARRAVEKLATSVEGEP